MKLLHTIRYRRQFSTYKGASNAFADLCNDSRFVGGYISSAPPDVGQQFLQILPKAIDPSSLAVAEKPESTDPQILTIFFHWNQGFIHGTIEDENFPEECQFIVIPEPLRHEYGILKDVEFFDPNGAIDTPPGEQS